MDEHTWKLIIQQLEAIERQNAQQLKAMHDHMAEESLLRDEVNKHTAYFKIIGIVTTALLTAALSFFGLK